MSRLTSARRREAEDLQALLAGGRPSTPAARQELAPLVALARGLAPAAHVPSQDFRAALRDRLVAEAADRVPAPAVPAPRPRRAPSARVRQAVAAVAVASVVAGVGAAAASTRALPGDSLYGLKRSIEDVQLSLAHGDVGHGRQLLDQADARLSEAERLAAGEHAGDPATQALVGQALADLQSDVTLGSADLTRAYRLTGDDEPMVVLEKFATEQRERLDDLLPLVDPSLRAEVRALADQLAGLDEQAGSVLAGSASALPGTGGAGSTSAAAGAADGLAVVGATGRAVDAGLTEGLGSTGAARAARAAGPDGVPAAAGGTSTGAAADPVAAAVGVVGAVTGTSTGAGPSSGGPAGGTSTGTVGGVGTGVVGSGGTASVPRVPVVAPSAPVPTSVPALPVPLPTSSPQAGNPVSTGTGAAPLPLPSPTGVPTVRACVPVPPLTTC